MTDKEEFENFLDGLYQEAISLEEKKLKEMEYLLNYLKS